MQGLLSENLHVHQCIAPAADPFAGTATGDWVKLSHYRRCMFLIIRGVGTTGTATITVQAATNAAGDNPEAVVFHWTRALTSTELPAALTKATTAGFTTTASGIDTYKVEVDARDLPAGKPFVALKSVEVADSPVLGTVVAVLGDAAHVSDTPLAATA